MIRVIADNTTVYRSDLPETALVKLTVSNELNNAGSAELTLPPIHDQAQWGNFETLFVPYKCLVTISRDGGVDDDPLLFRGRVISTKKDFYLNKTAICEGEMAFFRDSVIGAGTITGTLSEIFETLVAAHNSQVEAFKRFAVDTVSVTTDDEAPSLELKKGTSAMSALSELVKKYGGYIVFSHNENLRYRAVNWLGALSAESQQPIKFGSNLIDLSTATANKNFANRIIAYGKETDGVRPTVTVEDQTSKETYGTVSKVVYFDDAEDSAALQIRANQALAEHKKIITTLSVKALDLVSLTGAPELSGAVAEMGFPVGMLVLIESSKHGLDDYYLVAARAYDLLDPKNDKITLGGLPVSLTGELAGNGG